MKTIATQTPASIADPAEQTPVPASAQTEQTANADLSDWKVTLLPILSLLGLPTKASNADILAAIGVLVSENRDLKQQLEAIRSNKREVDDMEQEIQRRLANCRGALSYAQVRDVVLRQRQHEGIDIKAGRKPVSYKDAINHNKQ